MKQGIHPNYREVNVTCSCGNKFVTKSAMEKKTLTSRFAPCATRSIPAPKNRRYHRPRGQIQQQIRQPVQTLIAALQELSPAIISMAGLLIFGTLTSYLYSGLTKIRTRRRSRRQYK
ncbi:50S ribosomal protein L31 [Neisseria gonorrhoeae]|uniref:50S ribosomal protein L31 n=1 Tax=Neisseria gonorrhoeae TaxID=485 RepID=A0A378W1I7_NEIGO|nr:50S ribosomal protein L31 [Neisseria gonorrhoeae]